MYSRKTTSNAKRLRMLARKTKAVERATLSPMHLRFPDKEVDARSTY